MSNDYLTLSDLAAIKKKYKKASAEKQVSFQFKGMEILTVNAKFVIEYQSINFAK